MCWFLVTEGAGSVATVGYLALAATIAYGLTPEIRDARIPPVTLALVAVLLLLAVALAVLLAGAGTGPVPPLLVIGAAALVLLGLRFEADESRGGAPRGGWRGLYLRWFFPVVLLLAALLWAYLAVSGTAHGIPFSWSLCLFLTAGFSLVVYLFASLNLFGGADAWALILVAVTVPLYPAAVLLGYVPFPLPGSTQPAGFLPYAVLVNAAILNLAIPAAFLLFNVARGNRAPFPYTLFGFPVPGDRIREYYGFVMEDIREEGGTVTRRFIPVRVALGQMMRGERVYTKELREHPEKHRERLAVYRRAGHVWISYGIPFIVPILAGFLSALVFGDLMFALVRLAAGG